MGVGGSARYEYERTREARVQRVRDNRSLLLALSAVLIVGGATAGHLLLGAWWFGTLVGLAIVIGQLAPSRREVAWRKGAEGEQAVGRVLDGLVPPTRALHDRRIPGSRANIDHILVASAGVWTIDAKNYTGKLETRRRGKELWIGGRNRSKLLEQAHEQAAVVRRTLAAAGPETVPVNPALCFLGVEWPLLFPPDSADGVRLLTRRGLRRLAAGQPALSAAEIRQVSEQLDARLHPGTESRRSQRDVRLTGAAHASRSAVVEQTVEPRDDVIVRTWKRYGKHRL
ncbi:MAG TPA: nuclease-related domain-containing protein [Nitriliruptorales bacterium]|nr:nuclease-related domain-containing protein [Nitriliruptorales bacterium]